jgi:hypothetical protein
MPAALGAESSYGLIHGSPGGVRRPIPHIQATVMRRRTKIALAVIGLAIVWPFLQIGMIAVQAQYYANGRPYCIEVSGDRLLEYRQVGSISELSGLTLHAPFMNSGGSGSHSFMQWTFHALLVVDTGSAPEWRNWSYWHQHFDWLTPQQVMMTRLDLFKACQPEMDFVWKLPLFPKN